MASSEIAFKNPPTYRVVREWLESRLGKDWLAGQRLPTIAQISKELGVGYVNIQRALREMADAGLVVSRRGAGTFVNEKLPRAKKSPRTREVAAEPDLRGKRIAIPSLEHLDEFLVRMTRSFSERIEKTGCELKRILYDNHDYKKLIAELPGIDADGIVLCGVDPSPDIYFAENQLMVIVSPAVETPVAMPGRYDIVSVEQEQGGLLAGRCLRDAGIKSACFIGVHYPKNDPRPYDTTSGARLKGFEMGFGKVLPAEHRLSEVTYAVDVGAKAVERYLQLHPRPQGVFTASDEIAVGFILGALTHGLEAGRDYQIVGFDGQQLGREMHSGALTTVEVPAEVMGERAAELLIDRFAEPDQPVRRLLVGCSLYEGTTVRRRES